MMILKNEEPIRAFVAINLNQAIKDELQKVTVKFRDHIKDSRTRISWVGAESIHLTLKFLGTIEQGVVDPIMQNLEKAVVDFYSFKITLGDIGVFPNRNQPRVIWIGTQKGGDNLCKLQTKVEGALNSLGFEKENRGFSPHLTLGRIKGLGSRGEILRALQSLQGVIIGQTDVGQVSLMKSKLTPKGAVYTELGSVGLKKE